MENLVGRQFGRLIVLSQFRKKNHSYCHCQCSCGTIKDIRQDSLKNGVIQSCGCLHKEQMSANYIDLTGKKFNRWTVLSKATRPKTTQNSGTYWLCQCECGTQRVVWGKSLQDGSSKSCGCLKGEKLVKDLTGQQFGRLTVLKLADDYSKGHGAYWVCQCQCGNIVTVSSSALVTSHTKSCGCLLSYGEELVASLLQQLNYTFRQQYMFSDLIDKAPLRFDFAVFDSDKTLKCLIEIQGRQHYMADTDSYGWNTEEHLQNVQKHDQMKVAYCKNNNIALVIIDYSQLSTLSTAKLKELICLE